MKKTSLIALSTALLLFGCTSKEEVNKPADYWYQKLIKDIRFGDLETADKTYSSLVSEHIRSPLIEEALLILAQGHIDHEEYILANFYLDEYIKRYADAPKLRFAKLLKIRAAYLSLKRTYRAQNLLQETIADAQQYLRDYPDSPYCLQVESMLTAMQLAKEGLDREIASLYGRINKPQAQQIYTQRADNESIGIHGDAVSPPERSWYRVLFE